MFKDVSIWCLILAVVILMFVHHILSDKPLFEGNENIDEEETTEFKKRLHIKDERLQLPEISRFDPQALVVGIRPGEVCKIDRSSVTALSTEYYRVCV